MDDPKAGWNPKSSTELFLGLLPYLLTFVVIPIFLLLVCWCSRYLVRLCSRKLSSTGSTGFWARLCPGRQMGVPTPTCRSANSFVGGGPGDSSQHPETLFTNYTNYNPILEGELDLFPISYTAQSGESLPSRATAEPQRTVDQCANSLYVELSLLPLASEFGLRESRINDPPPSYPDEYPPPSYESLFPQRESLDNKTSASANECSEKNSGLRGVVVN